MDWPQLLIPAPSFKKQVTKNKEVKKIKKKQVTSQDCQERKGDFSITWGLVFLKETMRNITKFTIIIPAGVHYAIATEFLVIWKVYSR